MMLPSEKFGGLDFIPTEFGFGILVGTLNEKTLTFARCQDHQRGGGGCIGKCIITATILVTTQNKPFFAALLLVLVIKVNRPDSAGSKLGGQCTALGTTKGQGLPNCPFIIPQVVGSIGFW